MLLLTQFNEVLFTRKLRSRVQLSISNFFSDFVQNLVVDDLALHTTLISSTSKLSVLKPTKCFRQLCSIVLHAANKHRVMWCQAYIFGEVIATRSLSSQQSSQFPVGIFLFGMRFCCDFTNNIVNCLVVFSVFVLQGIVSRTTLVRCSVGRVSSWQSRTSFWRTSCSANGIVRSVLG